jgi:hypothetical protein
MSMLTGDEDQSKPQEYVQISLNDECRVYVPHVGKGDMEGPLEIGERKALLLSDEDLAVTRRYPNTTKDKGVVTDRWTGKRYWVFEVRGPGRGGWFHVAVEVVETK